MKIPSRDECEKLLLKYNFPQRKRRHVKLVGEVADFLGTRLKAQGISCDLDLIFAGAMLHDIDKGIEGAGEVHPKKAVEIFNKEGYPEVARICETHTINAFLDSKTRPNSWEEKCVALADKMVKDEIIGVDARFRLWNEEDLPEEQKEVLRKSYPLVKTLEKEIMGIIGMKPEEIRKCILC